MELFCEALARPSPEARAAYLAQICGDDTRLRARVEELLQASNDAGRFLEGEAPAVYEGPGSQIGPYKLLEQIGEGGFGLVFMAEQTSPVRRRVALKVLKPGMDTRRVVARFEAERQALAMMDDVHIARVLDGGETASGRPYFVMELVCGAPITDFCDQHSLAVRERLRLLLSICQAVEHAHLKGIIHRDLKPSNILVTLRDGEPLVKVIDFGIAKALGEPLTEKTLFTGFSQMVGTPRYMSPEQVDNGGLDIDTRTDIYALGVLLYELLTGTTPLDEKRVRTAGYEEVCRLIREEEPPAPSTRVATLGQAATTFSSLRGSDPVRLGKLFRGELDWIALKALDKDRNRRYKTASAFAADVQHYLADEPVLACPPSKWYRFRKFARRHTAGLVASVAVLVAVLAGLAGLATSNALIRREQSRTQDEKERAEEAEKLAEQQADQIRRDLSNLTAANALADRGRWYASVTRWDDAYAAFTRAIELRPDHAALRAERGDLLALLGLLDLAAADFWEEMKLRQPDGPFRYFLHALLRLDAGDTEGYRLVRSRMVERFGGTTNPTFASELMRASLLGPDPEGDPIGDVERCEVLLADSPQSRYRLQLLGISQYRAGRYEEAVERLRASLDAPADSSVQQLAYSVLAMARHKLGQAAEARQALDTAAQAIDGWNQQRYEANGGNWVMHRGAASVWPVAWWEWLECQWYYREAKQLIDGQPPPDDPRLLVLRARAFAGLRWDADADAQYAAALQHRPNDPRIRLEAHRSRGYNFVERKQWHDAAVEFVQASELARDDSELWRYRAVAHLGADELDDYRRVCQEMFARFRTTHDSRAACNTVFACVLDDEALPDMALLTELADVAAPAFHFGSYVRGAALYRAGRYDEAIQAFEATAKIYRRGAWEWSFLAMASARLGRLDEARLALTEASRWIEEANHQSGDNFTGARAMWGGWPEQAVYPVLLREAELVVGGADKR